MSIQAEEATKTTPHVDLAVPTEPVPGIPIAEFRKGLADFLNRVHYQKERFPLARHDKNVAALVSTSDSDTLYLLDRIAAQFGVEREELIEKLLVAGEKKERFGGVVSSEEQRRLEKLDAAARKLGISPDELLQQTVSGAEKSEKVRREREVCDT